mmetsp:Transcript_21605/g.53305  ORF Transcript_21605/g.53305 Transcript_21605/m.53305 type:complete len:324 (-) Transcript_21605:319-1290(-)
MMRPGSKVRLKGLATATEHNGSVGHVVEIPALEDDPARDEGRVFVKLAGGMVMSVKHLNLEEVAAVANPSPAFIPADAASDVTAAVEHAECCICYDALCDSACSVLSKDGSRICGHFFHSQPCAESLLNGHHGGSTCPICRAEYDGIMPIPEFSVDPRGWFRAVDVDGDGKLSQEEVREVIKALMPLDWRRLENELPALWDMWDADGSGYLEEHELNELILFMKLHIPRFADAPVPSIESDAVGWFKYFDEDDSGTLEKGELTRALIKTFNMSSDLSKVQEMRRTVDSVWNLFDPDGSNSIDRDEFVMRDGLADTLVATMAFL